jgi:hypothetical protein
MPQLRDHRENIALIPAAPGPGRPVVIGTLSVRVDVRAERMAIDSALHAGVRLVVANILPFRPYPTTLGLVGPEGLNLPHEEDLDAVRATARRAADSGIDTELLRVTTRRPIRALMEIVRERDAGLLVFGPDLRLVGRRRFARAARRVRQEANCLVWIAPDG